MAGRTIQLTLVGNNSSAIKAIDQVAVASEKAAVASSQSFDKHTSKIGSLFTTLDSQLANFGIPLTGALSSVGAKFEETGGKASTFHEKLSALGGATILGAAAGLTLLGTESIHLADNFEESHARLETAVHNIGQSFDEEKGKIADVDSKLESLGFTNADTENSMSRLVLATKDVGKATELMGLAADIARARGIDLASATDLLVKVEAGRYTQLTRLGIATKEQVKGFKDAGDATDFLTQKFGGQAQAYAKTFAGELQTLKATGEDLAVGIGQHLIPVIEESVTVLNDGVHAFESVNEATDGWLGKLLLATAAVPAAVFVYDKLDAGLARIASSYGRAATAVGLKSAADAEDASANTAAALATDARVASIVELDAATESLTASELADIAAQGGLSANQLAVAAATQANVAAKEELTAAAAAVAAAETVDIATLEALTAANAEATASTTALAIAKNAEIAADDAIVGSTAATAVGSLASVTGIAAAGFVVAAGAAVGLGAALDKAFGGGVTEAARVDTEQIKDLAAQLTEASGSARVAQTALANIVGPQSAADLKQYADLLTSGANASDAAKFKVQAFGDANRLVANEILGVAEAAKLSDADLAAIGDVGLTAATGLGLSADKAQELTGALQTQGGAVGTAVSALDKLTEKYGAAGVQTLQLQAAQKKYADDLARSSTSEAQLTQDKQRVIDASKIQATTQNQVNEATQKGSDEASKSADALKAQDDAAKQLGKDLDELGKKAGPSLEALAKGLHVPDEAVKTLTTDIGSINDSADKAFGEATDIVKKFGDQTKVSFGDVTKFELEQLGATQKWATNLAGLADKGLNQGLLKQLTDAGPKAAPLVQSILDNVSKGSIGTLNTIADATGKAEQTLKQHLDRAVFDAEAGSDGIAKAVLRTPEAIDAAGKAWGDYEKAAKSAADQNGKSKEANDAQTAASQDLSNALKDVVAQSKLTADEQAFMRGETATATEEHAAQKQALDTLAHTFPGLTRQVQDYEAKLGLIPPRKDTTVNAFTSSALSNVNTIHTAIVDIPPSRFVSVFANTGGAVSAINSVIYALQRIPAAAAVALNATSSIVTFPGRASGGPVDKDKPYLVGEQGKELVVPRGPGIVIPNKITEKLLKHKTLDSSDQVFLAKHGVSDIAEKMPQESALPHLASGGVAPFGSDLPTSSNVISVQFGNTNPKPVVDPINDANQALEQFVSTALTKVPDAESAIGDFAQNVSTDMQNVKTATDNVNEAFRKYHQSIIERNAAGRQVEADERDQARLVREHADAIHLKIAADRLAADQQKFADLSKQAQQARGEVIGAQTVEAQAKATLTRQLDPANFVHHLLQDTNQLRLFEVDLQKLVKEGDGNLARALATAGPTDAFQLAEGFARDRAKAADAENALKAEAAQTKDYNAFLKTLGISPKALGGDFNAGDILLVGERGPEFVQFPRAGHVTANGTDLGSMVNITINAAGIPERELARSIVKALQDHVRTAGPIRGLQFAA